MVRQLALWSLVVVLAVIAVPAAAAPYAALVMDARDGRVLHSRNADTRLHPASLTKMMTLYIAFEAIRRGEITLDTRVTVSRNAAAEPPSRLGLRAGSQITLRHLIRAAAIRSANDAATAIGEAIEGSEAAFARRMNRTAQALGMTRTTFRNAHGLTADGHLSTARDMTIMGRRLFYDYPQYYNIFSRRSTDAGIAEVWNTNRRFLDAYDGADGIKTGYTRAAGFNLTASAERGGVRIIATVFGGQSTPWRNRRMAELLDMGFDEAPARATVRRPALPTYEDVPGPSRNANRAPAVSLIPQRRPDRGGPAPDLVAAIEEAVDEALEAVPDVVSSSSTAEVDAPGLPDEAPVEEVARAVVTRPVPAPARVAAQPAVEIVVSRAAGTASDWAVTLGHHPSRYAAERVLLVTALAEVGSLGHAERTVQNAAAGWEARFAGLSQSQAERACMRLTVRNVDCALVAP